MIVHSLSRSGSESAAHAAPSAGRDMVANIQLLDSVLQRSECSVVARVSTAGRRLALRYNSLDVTSASTSRIVTSAFANCSRNARRCCTDPSKRHSRDL